MKKLLPFLILLTITSCSFNSVNHSKITAYKVGDIFKSSKMQDQHGRDHQVGASQQLIAISFDMSLSKKIHTELDKKGANFLKNNHTQYVADISKMPSIITTLFAGPKMRKYNFPIIWAESEEFKYYFPKKENKLTVLKLGENKEITSIDFYDNFDFLKKKNN